MIPRAGAKRADRGQTGPHDWRSNSPPDDGRTPRAMIPVMGRTRLSYWAAAWPWALMGSAVVFGSRALEDHRPDGPDARLEAIIAVAELAAMVAVAAWGFRRIVLAAANRWSATGQVLCFAVAVPALAWSNPTTHTRVFVGIATALVAVSRMALLHQEQARERDEVPAPPTEGRGAG